jgi:D-alanyl-D-alanine carboxypeptidase (penicillin-binding protein 5/6)
MRFSAIASRAIVVTALVASLPFASPAAFAQVPPPAVQANAWILVDATSNQTLASNNAEQRVEPASLTKLVSTYLVFAALRDKKISMDQIVEPSDAVRRVGTDESRMFIEANKPVSVHDLVHGMITQSGNDAAIALAELVGGSESGFVDMMNKQAAALGMTHSHFADVNGMPDPNHYTTAGDLAIVATHLIRDFPQYYGIFSEKEFTYNNIKQPNRNRLLWLDSTVDGLKTGHTNAAGYCLIASARRPNALGGERRLVVVMMGEPKESARVQDSLKMLNYGYQAYDGVRLYSANQVIDTARVFKGAAPNVKIGVKTEQYITVPKGSADKIKPVLVRNDPIVAPIADGQQLGIVKIMSDDKELAQFPAVALNAVPQGGFISRMWDTALLMMQKKK